MTQCRVPAFALSEHHRFHPCKRFSVLETLQSHLPAPESLINGQRVKRHLKKIRGPNTIWEPFSSPSLPSTLYQYSSNESSCLPAANVTACVCHLAGGVNPAQKAAFSNTLLPARLTGHREQTAPWAVQGLPRGWLSGQTAATLSHHKGSFPGQAALSLSAE